MIRFDDPPSMGDPRWGAKQLGLGAATIGQRGCLLLDLTALSLILGGDHAVKDPLDANNRLRGVIGAYSGSGMGPAREAAAYALGLSFDGIEHEFSAEKVARRVLQGLPTVLGVNYKPGASSGESDSDHFVLALGVERNNGGVTVVHCYDPAFGDVRPFRPVGMVYKGHPAQFVEMRLYSSAT